MRHDRPVQVIKHPPKSEAVLMREHELGMLHLLIRKYPKETESIRQKVLAKPQGVVVRSP